MDVPQSIRDYIVDPSVRRAINLLFKLADEDTILDGLEWGELQAYYRAQLAARQFESEWGIFGLRAWGYIWGGLLENWKPLSPSEQTQDNQYDARLSLSGLRDTGDESLWFGRVFARGPWVFFASMYATPHLGLQLAVQCYGGNRNLRFPQVAAEPDPNDNWLSAAVALDHDTVDLSPLRELATQCVTASETQVSGKRTKIG